MDQNRVIMLTLEIMQAMWPNGNNRIPGLVEDVVAAAPAVSAKYGLASDLSRAAMPVQPRKRRR